MSGVWRGAPDALGRSLAAAPVPFTSAVTLNTVGTQSVTTTDTVTVTITGAQTGIVVLLPTLYNLLGSFTAGGTPQTGGKSSACVSIGAATAS